MFWRLTPYNIEEYLTFTMANAEELERIENKNFRDETIRMDGKLFVNCSFENCLLSYSGARCEWENTRFLHCRFSIDGSASYTVQILQGLGFKIVAPALGDVELH